MTDKRSKRPRGRHKTQKTGAWTATVAVQPSEATVAPEERAEQPVNATQAPAAGEPPCPVGDAPGLQQTAPETPSAPLPPTLVLNRQRSWQCMHEAVAGLSHRNANPPLPCQDAALGRCLPRPTLVVADGAGSAALSEVGSQAVVGGLARLLHTLDKQVAALLDGPVEAQTLPEHELLARNFALLLVKHAKGVLDDLAEQQRRPARDFRCTLLLIVAGQERALWLKIGDGALVFERRSWQADGSLQVGLHTLGAPGKGEFANTTQFIDDRLSPADVQSGLLELQDISGLAAMSDGAAEKLIAQDGSRVARQLEHWLAALRQGRLPRRDLTRSFYSEAFCAGSTGDDCSIGLLASELSMAAESPAD
ncbi:PP2C family serine/threonine-protein phosphatase [Azotobacter salinestris]|uniref:PP2C family serine/threonine-protein phosphatase n=1 Tax=Azotobacter salinestris TaxID=69964 RepID=UPI0032DF0D8F